MDIHADPAGGVRAGGIRGHPVRRGANRLRCADRDLSLLLIRRIVEPAGICVSSKGYEEVKRKIDIGFTDGGVQALKNIEDPIAVYHVGGAQALRAAEKDKAPKRSGSAGELPAVAIEANKADPHRFRHYREQAIGLYVAGRLDQAVETARHLVDQTPDLARNRLVLSALLQLAGETETARAQMAESGGLGAVRPTRIGDRDAAERFESALAQLSAAK